MYGVLLQDVAMVLSLSDGIGAITNDLLQFERERDSSHSRTILITLTLQTMQTVICNEYVGTICVFAVFAVEFRMHDESVLAEVNGIKALSHCMRFYENMSQFSTSQTSGSCALSVSPLLQQPYRNTTQSTPNHEWNETGRFTKEYLEQHPQREVKSLQELFEDDTFMNPSLEVASFSDTFNVSATFLESNVNRADELAAFQEIQESARALDQYIEHLDLELHDHRILDECWKHYKQCKSTLYSLHNDRFNFLHFAYIHTKVYEKEGGKAITALTVLQQQTSKSSRKLITLERAIRARCERFEALVSVLQKQAQSNKTLAAEVAQEVKPSTSEFQTKRLVIAAEQERVSALLSKGIASLYSKSDKQ